MTKKNTVYCATCRFAKYVPKEHCSGFDYACYHPACFKYDNCPKKEIAEAELNNEDL